VGQRALSKLDGRVVLVDSWLAAALSLQVGAGCGCLGRHRQRPSFSCRRQLAVMPLKTLLRLAHDVHALAKSSSFEHAVRLAVEIAKQNEGWLKSQHQGRGQNRRTMPSRLVDASVP